MIFHFWLQAKGFGGIRKKEKVTRGCGTEANEDNRFSVFFLALLEMGCNIFHFIPFFFFFRLV
jgi:hypothetical protein